jgi:hypothetical protein
LSLADLIGETIDAGFVEEGTTAIAQAVTGLLECSEEIPHIAKEAIAMVAHRVMKDVLSEHFGGIMGTAEKLAEFAKRLKMFLPDHFPAQFEDASWPDDAGAHHLLVRTGTCFGDQVRAEIHAILVGAEL